MTDEEVARKLRRMPFEHAMRWCKPGPDGCGCMGCANVSGRLAERGVDEEQWHRAMKIAWRQFME